MIAPGDLDASAGRVEPRGRRRARRRDHRHRRRRQEHRHGRDPGPLPRSLPASSAIAVVAVDPTRRRTGGALLGDRIRMNCLRSERVFMRSIATRRQNLATSAMLASAVVVPAHAGFGLVLVETAGIGQSDSEIVDLVDIPVYVMTSEYGAASQLEKIDMLDLASRRRPQQGRQARRRRRAARRAQAVEAEPRRVRRHRRRDARSSRPIASQFGDPGVNAGLQRARARMLESSTGRRHAGAVPEAPTGLATCARRRRCMTPSRASATWPRSPRTATLGRRGARGPGRSRPASLRGAPRARRAQLRGRSARMRPAGALDAALATRALRDARGRAARAAAIVGRASRGRDTRRVLRYDVRGQRRRPATTTARR